jgi:hypothetical protein
MIQSWQIVDVPVIAELTLVISYAEIVRTKC